MSGQGKVPETVKIALVGDVAGSVAGARLSLVGKKSGVIHVGIQYSGVDVLVSK